MVLKNWNIEEMTGYKPKTTFYTDFSIADKFGKNAIIDTYKRAFNEWKDDMEYFTELSMVLNWKSWEHENNQELCSLYVDLYEKTIDYVDNNWDEQKQHYYYVTTD